MIPRVEAQPPRLAASPLLFWPFLQLALIFGLGVGFLLAGLLPLARWFAWPPAAWWPALVAAHGRAQLFGWVTLFVLGVVVHFLPRLRGARLVGEEFLPWVRRLLAGGLGLSLVAELATPAVSGGLIGPTRLLAAIGQLTYTAGVVWLHGLLVLTSRKVPSAETRPAWRSTRPYLALAGLSLVLALTLESAADVLGLITVADQVPAGLWHGWALALMLDGFLVPISLGFAVRTLPLFLRLPVPPAGRLLGALAVYSLEFLTYQTGSAVQNTSLTGLG